MRNKIARLVLTWAIVIVCAKAQVAAQVLSRLGSVSDDPTGVQVVFDGNWIYALSSTKLVLVFEVTPALVPTIPRA